MSITTYDHNLGFLGMVLPASDFDLLNNGNPFLPPIDSGPAPINVTNIAAQIAKVVRLYKEDK